MAYVEIETEVEYNNIIDGYDVFCYEQDGGDGGCGFVASFYDEENADEFADQHEDWHETWDAD